MNDSLQLLRFVLAIFAGMIVAYTLVEAIEFALVVSLNGSVPDGRAQYFALRNDPQVLIAKLFYSAAVGVLAGFVSAWIAGRAAILAGLALALIQAGGFIWAIISSNPLFSYTPTWVWALLVVIMPPAILLGTWLRARKQMEPLSGD
ncbi:MAG: hypothetical protein JSW71_16535 [Gemmatimonadota bacterium]|nr:MAG: hypothetical protein JSW71_16535 [Gemmatimonadota bacterium]